MTTATPNAPASASAIHPILDAYGRGHRALILQDRPLYDVDLATLDNGETALQTLEYILERELWRDQRILLVRLTLAGVDPCDAERSNEDRRRGRARLARHGLRALDRRDSTPDTAATSRTTLGESGGTGVPTSAFEVIPALRDVGTLLREPSTVDRWADGEPLRFAFYLPHAEHLLPAGTTGPLSDQERLAVETLGDLGASYALRRSGHFLLLRGRPGVLHEYVVRAMHTISLPHPDALAKRPFVAALQARYPKARLAEGATPEAIAHLTAHAPNRGLEAAFYAAQTMGTPVTIRHLRDQKARDVAEMSENTLLPLDPSRVEGVQLVGRTVQVAAAILADQARRLAAGDPTAQITVLLGGPPSSGKTDLVNLAAHQAGVPAFELLSPKNQYVGETERLARLQMRILKMLGPCFGVIDEITEAMPMARGGNVHHGDSGASQAVQAEMLKALSDETRRGRVLLGAMTNVPDAIFAAMLGRFLFVPVLAPVRPDYPDIILAIARRLTRLPELEVEREALEWAGGMLFDAEATPREISKALVDVARPGQPITADTLIGIARDLLPEPGQRLANAYADLCAVRLTRRRSFLPWHEDPASYPYPPHLTDLVDRHTGDVDMNLLEQSLERMRPYANV